MAITLFGDWDKAETEFKGVMRKAFREESVMARIIRESGGTEEDLDEFFEGFLKAVNQCSARFLCDEERAG